MCFKSTLPIWSRYCSNENKLMKCVFVEEFFSHYGRPLTEFACPLIGAAIVIWQIKAGNADIKNELKNELNTKFDALGAKVDPNRTECQHVQSIDLGSVSACLGAISRDRTPMCTWKDIVEGQKNKEVKK